jgi:hypothetical protein
MGLKIGFCFRITMSTAILVLSCGKKQYAPMRERFYKSIECVKNIPIYFLFGTPETKDFDNNVPEAENVYKIVAPCADYYEDIPRKMYYGFLTLANLGFQNVIKLDENIEIIEPLRFLDTALEELKTADYLALKGVGNRGLKYSESRVNFSYNHFGKVHDKRFDMMPTVIPLCPYAGGPGYALTRKSLLTFQKNEFDRALNEDTTVGFHLFSAGIPLVESKIISMKLLLDTYNVEPPHLSTLPVRIADFVNAKIGLIPISKNKRLFVDVYGGLGNQLFQIAAGLQYSLANNFELYLIPDTSNPRSYSWDSLLKNFKNLLLPSPNTPFSIYKEPSYGHREMPIFNNNIYLQGYFQSSKYCSKVKELLKSVLTFPIDIRKTLETKYGSFIFDPNVVIVHARQGDYKSKVAYHGPLSTAYYKNVKTQIETVVKNPFYLLTSDDDYWISNNIFGERSLILNEDMISLLWLFTQCKNIVMANSTFSWWGAYLSEATHVWVPNKWFGPSGPSDYETIYESNWVRVSTS